MFKVLNDLCTPSRGTKHSACVDLYASEDVILDAMETKLVGLGVCIDLDFNTIRRDFNSLTEDKKDMFKRVFKGTHYLQLMLRSSLGKKGLILPNGVGVIDMDYCDEIKLIIHNPNAFNTWEFDRYVGGVRIEDGVIVNGEYSLGEAQVKASAMFGNDENTAFKLKKRYYSIKKGDRIAQVTLIEHKSYLFNIETNEVRNGGFGSTDNINSEEDGRNL